MISPLPNTTKVTDWWIEQTQGKNVHLYIGHAAYKVGDDKDPAWNNPDEIPNRSSTIRNGLIK
nr:hypothetical protein [Paenibacillus larvae]